MMPDAGSAVADRPRAILPPIAWDYSDRVVMIRQPERTTVPLLVYLRIARSLGGLMSALGTTQSGIVTQTGNRVGSQERIG
jgi:hypothetical protein